MTLRVGLVGCGFIGRFHARNIRDAVRRGDNEIVYAAVCDRDRSRAEAFARIGGCHRVFDDARELIASDEVDVVYVCTETVEHPALVALAARHGKHVFCEKPLACSHADARAMLDAVERAGIRHQVGLVLRFSPVLGVMEALMAEADAGAFLTAHLRDDQYFPDRGQYASTWRGDVAKAGGGTLLEHSIHDVDLLRRLFGEIVSVGGTCEYTSRHPGIEDIALVRLRHAGGRATTLSSIWHAMDARPSTRRLEVFFEGGYFETEHDYFGSLRYQLHDAEPVTLDAGEVLDRYLALEGLSADEYDLRALGGRSDRAFLEAIRGGRPAAPDFHDALAAHRIVEACYASAREGREVSLEEIA